jgi:integrase
LARERGVSARVTLEARIEEYLAERRRLGFELDSMGHALHRFARYVTTVGHGGALTVDLMAAWACQGKRGEGTRATSARLLHQLRPFTRWFRQFEPATGVPEEAIFGAIPGRVAPHIYRDDEIVQLLHAAGRIGPPGGLRGVVMQTLFGLLACTGLRISEALALSDADVDLKAGVLTIHQSKFGKSRLVPLHSSAVQALARYRVQRACEVPMTTEMPFFVGTRGRLLGQPLGDRQARRVFDQLRRQLGWINRGGHGAPRIHDLRHSFAVHRLLMWHEQGVDLGQRMLPLSTYLGHAKISNTYWYLTGVPELMELTGKRFERFADPWEDGDE